MGETLLIMLPQDLITRQQLEATQQQLGEVDHPFVVAHALVFAIQLVEPTRKLVVDLDLARPQPLLLVGVDEIDQIVSKTKM